MLKIDWNLDGDDFLREKNGEDSAGVEYRYQKVSIRIAWKEIDK